MEERIVSNETVTKRVTGPVDFWAEWLKDCEERFSDVYYVKMMYDHQMAQALPGVLSVVEALERRITQLEKNGVQKQEEEKRQEEKVGPRTFGAQN